MKNNVVLAIPIQIIQIVAMLQRIVVLEIPGRIIKTVNVTENKIVALEILAMTIQSVMIKIVLHHAVYQTLIRIIKIVCVIQN